ncbi:hypothetical protein BCR35DRAFT_297863 [Leucosporidium creatinivorum]|uniref:Peptidase S54 rhomboid domain-containing protein n=1 Tax=Leucosporidium creatinivorum TaxID=106004 RepID=A0A1Y2G4K1_9BASI|nr:hypothetical protein BCR35DRAFT_297863 [Leucosporidium creatinivorum]
MLLSPLRTLRPPLRTLLQQLPRRFQSTVPPPPPHAHRIPIGRHVVFGVGLGAAGTLAAALLTNKDTADRKAQMSGWWPRQREWKGLDPELASLRLREVVQRVRKAVGAFGDDWRLPTILGQSYLNLTEEKRTQLAIIGLTAGVFVAWNIPACRGFAGKYLWHDPLATRPVTLLTSIFAHKSLPHFAFNSIALWSIGSACSSYFDHHDDLLPRSTSRYEFLAFFVAAGLFSSLVSHVYSVGVLAPRLRQATSSVSAARHAILPSLGSSGAIYACLIVTGLAYPEATVSLIFVPFIPIPIGGACAAMVTLDLAGLLRGWRLFDHSAHLGGAIYGLWYYLSGHQLFEQLRVALGGSSSSAKRIARS